MFFPLVSIIIPIYNVEQYLRRCLNSIAEQTYTNIEIILIDDGSSDGSLKICNEYADKDSRFTVIHKENGGLSSARNVGLSTCNGEYISFVDSDDWVSINYIKNLLKIIHLNKADIAIAENIKTFGQLHLPHKQVTLTTFSSKEALRQLFCQNQSAFIISCGKLYKKELFSNLRFPIGKYHEDEFTTYKLFYNSKKIVYTSEILYYYYQREGSIAHSSHPWDVLEFLEQRYLFFKEKNETDLLPFLLPPLCWQLLCAYWNQSISQNNSSKKHLNQLKKYIQDFKFCEIPVIHFIPLVIFSHFPQLYILYRKYSPLHIRKNF